MIIIMHVIKVSESVAGNGWLNEVIDGHEAWLGKVN